MASYPVFKPIFAAGDTAQIDGRELIKFLESYPDEYFRVEGLRWDLPTKRVREYLLSTLVPALPSPRSAPPSPA